MSYGICTYADAELLLLEALDLSTLEEAEANYNVDEILTECYNEAGCWDIQEVPEDTRADIIRNNQIW
jgi:hypothetical protein